VFWAKGVLGSKLASTDADGRSAARRHRLRRGLSLSAFAVGAFVTVALDAGAAGAQSSTSIIDLLQQDETVERTLDDIELEAIEADEADALRLWREALEAFDARTASSGPPLRYAEQRRDSIIEALISSAIRSVRTSPDAETPIDALNPDESEPLALAAYAIERLSDPVAQAWALREIAEVWLDKDEFVRGLATLRRANAIAGRAKTQKLATLARYGIVETALKGGPAGIRLARFVALQMRAVERRADAVRSIMRAELAQRGELIDDRAALLEAAESAIGRGAYADGAAFAAAAAPEGKAKTDPRSDLIARAAVGLAAAGVEQDAAMALLAIDDADFHGEISEGLIDRMIEARGLSELETVARLVVDAGSRLKIWAKIGLELQDKGYVAQADAAFVQVRFAAAESDDPSDLARAAEAFARSGRAAAAEGILAVAEGTKAAPDRLDRARAALAREFARAGRTADARSLIDRIGEQEQLDRALGDLAKGVARAGDMPEAMRLAGRIADADRRNRTLRDLAKIQSNRGALDDAATIIVEIDDSPAKAEALAAYAEGLVEAGRQTEAATALEQAAALAGDMDARAATAAALVAAGDRDAALDLAAGDDPVLKAIGLALAEVDPDAALVLAGRIRDLGSAERVRAAAGEGLHREGRLEDALATIRALTDHKLRTASFRRIAERQARSLDAYGLLDGAGEPTVPQPELRLTPEDAVGAKGESDDYRATAVSGLRLGQKLPPLPNLKRTAADVRAEMPAPAPGQAAIALMRFSLYNQKFITEIPKWEELGLLQRKHSPEFLFVESGVFDLASLHQQVQALDARLGEDLAMVRDGSVYLVRLPILIGPEATLLVRDDETLRLSRERGSYIVNAGDLWVIDASIVGWQERTNALAITEYPERYDYRPFVLTWSGGSLNAAGARFAALGYQYSKSYGLSYSSGPTTILKDRDETASRPVGAVIDTSFEQMFYAFYTLEADDIDVIGNELRDNVVYGLDPHDRSHHLRLAYNTAYGTRRRHGIIISREVDDSWIVGNISFDNVGTGIMIDRDSIGVYLYANTAIRNQQDGVTFFESSCGLVAANYIARNERAGIKVRNSWDIGIFGNHIAMNGQAAIEGYASELKLDSAHDHRDFSFDPYETVTSLSAADNRIEANDVGVRLADVNSAVFGRNHWIDQSPKLFSPEISELGPALVTAGRNGQDVAISNRCAQARPEFACRFRASGHMTGDGQGVLPDLAQADQCTPTGLRADAQETREPDSDDDPPDQAVAAQAAETPAPARTRRGRERPPVVSMIHVADQTGESAFRIFDPPEEAAVEGAAPAAAETPK